MQQNKTIALLIPSLGGGGAEKVFVNLSNFFLQKGYNVWMLTSKEGSCFTLLNQNVNVFQIHRFRNIILNYLLGIFQASFFLVKYKPHFLLCTLVESNLIGTFAKKISFSRTILILRQAYIITDSTNSERKAIKFLKKTFNYCDGIIANSPDTSISLQKYCGIAERKIKTIPNPVYNSHAISLSQKDIDVLSKDFILAVGNLKKEKDYNTLIEAFSYVRNQTNIDLLILGEGPLKTELIELAKSLKVQEHIIFYGFCSNPYPFFAKAKLFVLSSEYEGFGNVIVEALSVGTPIVSTNCLGGPSYILENGKYGTLVPVRNPKLLADAIIRELNKKSPSKDFLINRAKEFSIEAIGEKYLHYIEQLSKD